MTSPDTEIESWRAAWTANPELTRSAPAELRSKAVRQQRSLRTRHVAELGLAVVFLVFSAIVAWKNAVAEAYLWASIVWAGTIVATAFSVWNWKILWDADLKSVLDFTELYRKRCIASLRAARFGQAFLAVQVSISAPWLVLDYHWHRMRANSFAQSMILLAALTTGFIIFFARWRSRALQQLQDLNVMDCSFQD